MKEEAKRSGRTVKEVARRHERDRKLRVKQCESWKTELAWCQQVEEDWKKWEAMRLWGLSDVAIMLPAEKDGM